MSEYEKLDSKWIDENKSLINGRSTNPDGTEGDCYDAHYIHVLELQNLLVPEQEKEQKYFAKLKEIQSLKKEWLTNLSDPNYYAIDTKGLMFGEFMIDFVGMKTKASAYTLKDWERHGINDSNADFVKVEELEE